MAWEHSQGTDGDKPDGCLFGRKLYKQDESGHCVLSSLLPLLHNFFFWFTSISEDCSTSITLFLLLARSSTAQYTIMSVTVVFLVAFLTGLSGNPSVTMRPKVDLGSDLSNNVPDTAVEAHYMKEVRPLINAKQQ